MTDDDDETKRYWRHNRDPECFLLTESPLVAAPWHAVVVMTPAELAAHVAAEVEKVKEAIAVEIETCVLPADRTPIANWLRARTAGIARDPQLLTESED